MSHLLIWKAKKIVVFPLLFLFSDAIRCAAASWNIIQCRCWLFQNVLWASLFNSEKSANKSQTMPNLRARVVPNLVRSLFGQSEWHNHSLCVWNHIDRCCRPLLCHSISVKRSTSFQRHHAVALGLLVRESSSDASGAVLMTAGRLRKVFGKEEAVEVGRKLSRAESFRYIKAPIRMENYFSYHGRVHSAKWIKYFVLDAGAKKTLLKVGSSCGLQATMHAFVGPRTFTLRMLIDKDVVDINIGWCSIQRTWTALLERAFF